MDDRIEFLARSFAPYRADHPRLSRMRRIVTPFTLWLLTVLVCSATATAQTQSSLPIPASRHLALTYEVYAGGIHTFTFDVGLTLEPEGYRISAAGGTRGFASWLNKWDVTFAATGERMRPAGYVTVNSSQQPTKTMQLKFFEGGAFTVTRNLPDPIDEPTEEAELPAQLPANIVDPMSAALVAVQNLAASGQCEQTLPVFDGKRRYDISFHDVGPAEMPKSRIGIYDGSAVVCGVSMKRISGFKRPRHNDSQWEENKDVPPTLWLARVRQDMPPVPVRFTAALPLGSVVVHLTKVESSQELASSATP